MQITKNFNLEEFHCKDGTKVPEEFMANVTELAQNLQVLRDKIDSPIHINSAYRTPEYNIKVGGTARKDENGKLVSTSQHCLGKAADITSRDYTPDEVATIIEALIATGQMRQGGIGRYRGFTHYDIRGIKARW